MGSYRGCFSCMEYESLLGLELYALHIPKLMFQHIVVVQM